jgi:hypothetical protein
VRIVPFTEKINIEDLDTLYVIVKAVPFEGGFAPAVVIVSPGNDHLLSIEELGSLMDGFEIAEERVSEIIDFIAHKSSFSTIEVDNDSEFYDIGDEDDEDEEYD